MAPIIVCRIDASAQSRVALQVASALADRLRLGLILVHAARAPTPDLVVAPADAPVGVEQIDLLGRDACEHLHNGTTEAHALASAEQRLESESAAERVCAVALLFCRRLTSAIAGWRSQRRRRASSW